MEGKEDPGQERDKKEDVDAEEEEEEEEEEGPPPGWESAVPQLPEASSPSVAPEQAQIVCGSCRRLLSYPRGSKYIQCFCCQIINFVLEAHQVGQVSCGSCAVLLMYPYGASSVKCSSCSSITEIGEQNKRPPWSVQQGQTTPSS